MTTAIVLRRTIRHFEAGPCFYCSGLTFRPYTRTHYPWAQTRNHVFPASAIAKQKYGKSSTKRTQKIRQSGMRLLVVPACWQCNQMKGNTPLSQSLIDRARGYARSRSADGGRCNFSARGSIYRKRAIWNAIAPAVKQALATVQASTLLVR